MWAPPEITTGRLMSGPGAEPMLAASQSFTTFASAYEANINALLAHLGRLMATWQGPAAEMVAGTVTRHVGWLRLLHAQLIGSAGRMANQAAAFTTAQTSVIPMAGIIENKVTKAVAVATNFIGQNFPIITAKEIEYAFMGFHNVAVQAAYLAATVANTTFEPFESPAPLVTTDTAQDVAAATSAVDRLQSAATRARDDAEAAMTRFREAHLGQIDQLVQQALQQAPQYATMVAGMLFQQGQQVGQQIVQVPQQIVGSLVGNLTTGLESAYRVEEPGFFDTRADSPALDRLAGVGAGSSAAVAGLHVTGLGGLSGASTGFRFPASWDLPPAAAVPPSGPSSAAPGAAMRPMGPTMAPLAGATHGRDQDNTIKRPVTELIPVWGVHGKEVESVSVGELTREQQEAS